MKITLCGSTKFKEEYIKVNEQLTMEGHVVLSIGVFGHADKVLLARHEKVMLDKIHKAKIDMSDAIYVINVNGHIGESTSNEIKHAIKTGKRVVYHEIPILKQAFIGE